MYLNNPTSPKLEKTVWQYAVRRHDRTWLTRPAAAAGQPSGNIETWSPRISDCWIFETKTEACKAAAAHGAGPEDFDLIPTPKDPVAWLEQIKNIEIA